MKLKHYSTLISSIVIGGFAITNAVASDDFAEGDLLIGFYSVTGSAPSEVVGDDTLIVNLGPAHHYRENTQNNVAVNTINPALPSSSIGADLVASFGANWHNDASVRWCVIGGVTQLGAVTNGDPSSTSYYSKSRTNLATSSSGPSTYLLSDLSEYERGSISTSWDGFKLGTNESIAGLNGNFSTSGVNTTAVIIPSTNVNALPDFLPPRLQGEFFGLGQDPRQRLNNGVIAGGAAVEGSLNIFRFLNTTTGADLTAGASAGNAVVGQGQFIGTLTIDSSGNLKIAAIPSASPDSDSDGMLDSWETTYFGGLTQGAADDFDKDGTNNPTEYRLGLIPNSGSSFFATSRNATSGQLSWPSVVGVTFKVYRSTTLVGGSWSDIATVAGTSGTATYIDPTPPVGKAFYRIGLQP